MSRKWVCEQANSIGQSARRGFQIIVGIGIFLGVILVFTPCSAEDTIQAPLRLRLRNVAYTYPSSGFSLWTKRIDGYLRRAELYVPTSLPSDRPAPLLIQLHGGGGNISASKSTTRNMFIDKADAEHFILVMAEAVFNDGETGGHWNDGRGFAEYKSHAENIDDVKYFRTLIDELSQSYSGIDTSRIYLFGASNGGFMTQRLACSFTDRIAAFASNVASIAPAIADTCNPATPRPILITNGTEDTLIRYDTYFVHHPSIPKTLGPKLPIREMVSHWKKVYRCSSFPAEIFDFPDIEPADASTVTLETYTCRRAPLVFYRVNGGGHAYPGGIGQPGSAVGASNRDINSADIFWDFFKQYRR